ncbi:protein transporter HofB [Pasteurellaceae bacterium Macca]|nr:protein transporter HofB [Pasteurellaceae bacterium Macca]
MKEKHAIFALNHQQLYEIPHSLWQKNCAEKHLLLRYLALPIKETERQLWLAIDDEANLNACEIFAFISHKQIEPVIVASEELKFLLNALSPETTFYEESPELNLEISPDEPEETHLDDPIIQLLDNLFKFCLTENASDIHIEPHKQQLLIRLRIDGVLYPYKSLSSAFSRRVVSRIKLLAKLDISETRRPQDGQFSFTTALADTLDFRVSTLPINEGEKVVLRLQKNKPTQLDFATLGFTEKQGETLRHALTQPQGLILVTGPTGSGKSITLYSALNYLNHPDKHILTAEDPIEIEIEGLIQSQVNHGIGLDFSQLLRTFLRQDPDIIMLGEIRDEESARIALRAAQTGHLVLSTLHTNDALSAVERLNQLGIQDYEIANSLILVVAQRLLRKICPTCGGEGCQTCFQGYKGRTGIYQLLSRRGKSFKKTTACLDYPSLLESAKEKIAQGITNEQEVGRILGEEFL